MKLRGVVLAGGKSERFGEDKALVKINGVPMLERAVNLLQKLELEPVVITAEGRDYAFLDCDIKEDLIPGVGPIGGLYTACRYFPKCHLLTITCDMPGLTLEALKGLIQNFDPVNRAILFSLTKRRYQPFPGIYDAGLEQVFKNAIDEECLSMQDVLHRLSNCKLVSSGFKSENFININDPKMFKQWCENAQSETVKGRSVSRSAKKS